MLPVRIVRALEYILRRKALQLRSVQVLSCRFKFIVTSCVYESHRWCGGCQPARAEFRGAVLQTSQLACYSK
jgi:hypothetical protein